MLILKLAPSSNSTPLAVNVAFDEKRSDPDGSLNVASAGRPDSVLEKQNDSHDLLVVCKPVATSYSAGTAALAPLLSLSGHTAEVEPARRTSTGSQSSWRSTH